MNNFSSKITENLKIRYQHQNSSIFSHGKSYLSSARILEKSLINHPENFSPILTLLGLSIELFLKGLDVRDSSEKYKVDGLIFSGQPQTETNIKGGHDLSVLFINISQIDPELYQYLVDEFSQQYHDDLKALFERNKNVFPDSHYSYENTVKRIYYSEFNRIFNASNFLYETFDKLTE